MFTLKSKIETTIRVFLITVIMFNAFVPTAALARSGQEASPASSKETEQALPRALPEQKPVFYDAPQLTHPQQTSPEAEDPESPVPPKDEVEFTLVAEPAVVPANGLVTFTVNIRNHSKQELTSLVFSDSLESGLEYSQDSKSPVTYDAKKKQVTYRIERLGIGEEFSFSYSLTVTSSKRNAIQGKIWLHNVELNSGQNKLHLKTGAAIAVGLTNVTAKSELVPLKPEGGWNDLGRVAVHMAKENVGANALVMSSPTRIAGKGPALQFELDVFETSALAVNAGREFSEQTISLTKESKEKFKTPAFLEINLDGYIDLTNVPAGQEPYVATYDETHKIWVKVPILETDPVNNTVTVQAAHFSTWGAGLGSSLPQNGANVLLFDQPYTSLFTGSARYSIPVWTPAGRGGMQPDISLSYSSGTVDGVLGDVQAPWVGVGWNIDDVEIVRKITTDENGYGYRNEFALTLNGSLYQLVRDEFHQNRFFTDQAAFLYIERHNYALDNNPSTANTTGEWWEVVTTDGTRYRLGWNANSEQLALMYGYACTTNGLSCITPDGAYASLGYAGKGKDLVALRWRVDRVSDPHGNYMEYSYSETQPDPATTLAPFDRESYLESISYTGFDDPEDIAPDLAPAYQIVFNYGNRSTIGDVPTEFNIWDNLDSRFLEKIEVICLVCTTSPAQAPIRTYEFSYSLAPAPNANGTLTLTSLQISGGGYIENGQSVPPTIAPTIRFSYQDKDNRASGNGDVFKYPRLATIDNGSSGLLTFTYEHDGRGNNSWYNYRVQNVTLDSGLGLAKKQSYAYATPVYSGQGGLGSLTGYTTVTESLLDFSNGDAKILDTKHTFGTTGLDIGRELRTEWLSGTTVLRKTTNVYVTDNTGAPKDNNGNPFPGWNYRYLGESANYEQSGGSLTLISKNTYYRDPFTGNLLVQGTYLGNSLYRKTYYEYVTNPDPKHYILDKVSRVLLVNASNQVYSDTRYHYDGRINQAPTRGDVTLVQRLTGNANETIDTATHYNVYGNAISVKAYRGYGTVNTPPTAAYWESTTSYDSVQNEPTQSYPMTVTNALGQSSSMAYLYTLGAPYQTADPNGWTTSTAYDGLGRSVSVTPPGLAQPGTWYAYPSPDPATGQISAPYSVEMQILDTIANKYRSVWGIYDGAGRMLQTQVDAGNNLLVNTTLFNAQGLARQQSLPYAVNGAGGNYISNPGNQFTTTEYDALGRVTKMVAPGNIATTTAYEGLTTAVTDPNGNKVSRTADGLGRMIAVAEFSDATTVYATTTYFYDSADRLIRVKDAKFNTTTIQYDWLGRKLGMDDPDMGVWTYAYDSLGNMSSQTDARGQQLTFAYDALNRLLTKSDGDVSTVDSTYTYGTQPGTIGLRTGMTDASGSSNWTYANYGRTVTETRTIGTEQHSITTNADWLGRALTTTYDDGEVVSYTYDELGRPEKLESNQTANTLVDLAYNVLGQIETQSLGNGTLVTNTYDPQTARLTNRTAEHGSTVQLNLSYEYDLNGNITRLTDHQLGETQFYDYDFLNRLTGAIGAQGTVTAEPATPQTYGQAFEYDKVGNILQINNWGTAPSLPTSTSTSTLTATVTDTPVVTLTATQPETATPTPADTPMAPQGHAPSDHFAVVNYVAPQAANKGLLAPVYQEESTATAAPTETPTATATQTPTATGSPTNSPTATKTPISTNTPAGTSTPSNTPTPRVDDAYTVSLLHMNGADASTTFTDGSGKTWTAAGNARIDTAQSVFGGASAYSDGSGDYIYTNGGSDFAFGTGDFTIDFWARFASVGTVNILYDSRPGSQGVYPTIYINASNKIAFYTNSADRIIGTTTIATNTWYHIAVTRSGTSTRLFINGVQEGPTYSDSNNYLNGANRPLILNGYNGSYSIAGWMDELRVSKGIARWTTNFTPPASEYTYIATPTPLVTSTPTATPGVDDPYTISLFHMNGAEGSGTFTDESGKTWTANGNARIDAAQGKFGGASGLFDGNGDYLSTQNGNGFNFGSGNFTLDFWIRINSFPGAANWNTIFSQSVDGNNRQSFALEESSGAYRWKYASVNAGTTSIVVLGPDSGLAVDTWYHVALVRSGNNWYIFRDGVQKGGTLVSTYVVPNLAGTTYIGSYNGVTPANDHDGWIDEFRASKGIARWTKNFVPPASEYGYTVPTPTPITTSTPTPAVLPEVDDSYTVSLLHANGADGSTAFMDASGKTWAANGQALIDTTQSKFGESSAFFDGLGDYVSTADSTDFTLGTGPFTIDFWIRFNALPSPGNAMRIFGHGNTGTALSQFFLRNTSGTYTWELQNYVSGALTVNIVKSSPGLSTDIWYHMTVVRDANNNFYIFQNGTQAGTASSDPDPMSDPPGVFYIGVSGGGADSYFNGWIDEFRFTKGLARWTSNFTPPTSEYAPGTMQESLMAHWDFEQVVPAPPNLFAPEAAPNDFVENSATLQNGVVPVSDGANGSAIQFDGQSGSALVANQTEIRKNGSFSLSAWINPSALVTNRTQYILNKGVSATDFDYGFITTSTSGTATPTPPANVDPNGKLVFRVGDLTPNKVVGPVLPINTWTLVTGVYDQSKGELRLYINGTLSAVEKVTGTVSMGTGNLSFSPTGNLYHGKLDEVRFYNRALTGQEVGQLFGTFATPTPLPGNTPTATSEATSTPTATALPMSAQQWGTGNDGSLVVSGTFNLNANTNGNNSRSCADGVAYSVTSLGSTIANLSTAPAAGCLNPGDEIMLVNLVSGGPNDHNAGAYEFLRVASVNGSSVSFASMKARWYGDAWHSDNNIGVNAGQQRVMLVRVPNYNDVTVTGTLTSNAFDGYKYGVIAFRVAGTLTGTGFISADSKGFAGGNMNTSPVIFASGYSAGPNGLDDIQTHTSGNGGGGGYATAGGGNTTTYGSPQLNTLFFGSGGGGSGRSYRREQACGPSGTDWCWLSDPGAVGASGGGIIFVAAETVNFPGSIQAKGGDKQRVWYGGPILESGGGAGGSIRVEADIVTLGTLAAGGGIPSDIYGDSVAGGRGRIAVYYQTGKTITTSNPTFYEGRLGQSAPPTPTPTPINLNLDLYGTGADGDLTVAGTFNLNTSLSGTRVCADGISYSVVQLASTSAKLSTSPLPKCLVAGDEVMLIHLSGSGPNTGKFESLRVGAVVGDTIYFRTPKVNFYGANANDDSNIGVGAGQQRVMLMRVPNYNNVTVNGRITVNAFNGYKGGVIAFRVANVFNGSASGSISADFIGFGGGNMNTVPVTLASGYSAGPNGYDQNHVGGNGGGGGHATAGGGNANTYGNPQLGLLFFGSGGGGSGHSYERVQACGPDGTSWCWKSYPGAVGAWGGGIVFIAAETVNFPGSIQAKGGDKQRVWYGGPILESGGGAGGSIRIEGDTVTLGTLAASGGIPSDIYGNGVAGGLGRIAIYYADTLNNSATICAQASTYCKNISQSGTPTVTPTSPTPSATPSPTSVPQGWYGSDYTYPTSTGAGSTDAPHAVTAVDRGSFTDSFHYDLNGSMDCRTESGVTYKQTYNAENRIASIQKLASGTCAEPTLAAKWDFTYDGDGVHTGQSYTPYTDGQPGTPVITRYYFGGAYETTGSKWKKYYSFGGTTIMRDASGYKYFLTDQLGSTSVVLDEQGTILEQQRYLPLGQARLMPPYAGVTSTDFTYTGQRNLPDTGLMDYKARFYSPALGRFIQPDTIIPGAANPQSWNRFSYVENNPMRYTDPTGHKLDDGGGGSDCDWACIKKIRQGQKNKKTLKGASGLGQGSGGSTPPAITGTPPAPVVAVPNPQPPGSPSVPILTTVNQTTTVGIRLSIANFQPIPLPYGWTMDPKNPVSILLGPVANFFDSLGLRNEDGNPIEIQDPYMFPRAWRETDKILTVTTTTTTTDQYGKTTVDTDIFQSNPIPLLKEENRDGLWIVTYPTRPINMDQATNPIR